MTNDKKQRREELRRRRLEAEKEARTEERRSAVLKIVVMMTLVAVLAVTALAFAVTSGDGGSESSKSSVEVERLLGGVPQEGTILGNPKAKITVVEFGDLQCVHCKQFSESVIPLLIEGPVESGDVNLDFRNLPVIEGDDSEDAARASLAASLQGRYWQFIELFYAEQGIAETGYVTDEFLRSIAEKAGVEDLERWEADRNDPRWDTELDNTGALATELGITGTPGVAIRDSSGALTRVGDEGETPSLEEIERAIANIAQ